ncbi:hypothetical protein ATANTOWER_032977 [Ataeniobius toweri]|uniref:LAGLIDADG homing endonuclease n=1 Tax=Ataeniobius toweri TaxID=208326 RepID=A0ABU7BPT6_9TELE|nr:hypothetical protein [Ataeniobius toweri]
MYILHLTSLFLDFGRFKAKDIPRAPLIKRVIRKSFIPKAVGIVNSLKGTGNAYCLSSKMGHGFVLWCNAKHLILKSLIKSLEVYHTTGLSDSTRLPRFITAKYFKCCNKLLQEADSKTIRS